MKKRILATLFLMVILSNLVNAQFSLSDFTNFNTGYYNSFSLTDLWYTIGPDTIILGSIFIISFAIIYFLLRKVFGHHNALAGVMAFAFSFGLMYYANYIGFDFTDLFYNIGLDYDFLYSPFLWVVLLMMLGFFIGFANILFLIGGILFLLGFFAYNKGLAFTLGVIFIFWGLLLRRKKKIKEMPYHDLGIRYNKPSPVTRTIIQPRSFSRQEVMERYRRIQRSKQEREQRQIQKEVQEKQEEEQRKKEERERIEREQRQQREERQQREKRERKVHEEQEMKEEKEKLEKALLESMKEKAAKQVKEEQKQQVEQRVQEQKKARERQRTQEELQDKYDDYARKLNTLIHAKKDGAIGKYAEHKYNKYIQAMKSIVKLARKNNVHLRDKERGKQIV